MQSFKNFEKKENKNSGWIKFEKGDTKIRLMTGYEPIGKHFDQTTSKSNICVGQDNGCELNHKERFQVKYLAWAIDRKDQELKLVELPYSVVAQIKDLADNEEYKFELLPEYDLTIKRTGEKLETEYKVIPARQNTPVTPEEAEMLKDKKDPADIIQAMIEKSQKPQEVETKVEYAGEEIDPEKIPF